MKKVLFLLCSALLVLGSCGQAGDKNGYTIKGTAEGTVDGDTVLLGSMQGLFGLNPIDTAVVKDGKFEMTGTYDGADVMILMAVHQGMPTGVAMIVLENANFDVKMYKDPQTNKPEVKGGQAQALYEAYQKELENAVKSSDTIALAYLQDTAATPEQQAQGKKAWEELNKKQAELAKQTILKNIPSAFSDMIFAYSLDGLSEEDINEIMAAMEKSGKQYKNYKLIQEMREADAKTAVGQKYIDFELAGPDGKPVKVSDIVAKNAYTLIDFWASWCGPCREEMPAVKAAYEAFHNKGFEVVGVSLDNDGDAWKGAIASMKLPWPQMSDLKGWECAAAKLYNVRSIPANVLVDKDGKIVAKDLRGEDLNNKLAELIK